MTVDDSWGLAPVAPPTSSDRLREEVKNLMMDCIKKFGGPENYLRARYATKSCKQEWLNYLGTIQPVSLLRSFSTTVDLPVSHINTLSEAQWVPFFSGWGMFELAVLHCPYHAQMVNRFNHVTRGNS